MKSIPTVEELSTQLRAAQNALHRSERIAAVAHFAADAMHEAAIPLEILIYLHYLAKNTPADARKVLEYMEEAETQALRLVEIHGRILRSHKEALNGMEEVTENKVT